MVGQFVSTNPYKGESTDGKTFHQGGPEVFSVCSLVLFLLFLELLLFLLPKLCSSAQPAGGTIMSNNYANESHYLCAGDGAASSELLQTLSESPSIKVRSRVAENSSTPLAVLFKLLTDVASEVRASLTFNPALPELMLADLAADENPDVRYAVAENLNSPQFILNWLLSDENPYVVFRAANTLRMIKSESSSKSSSHSSILAA